MSWRHHYPNVAAAADFVHHHPIIFIAYSVALVLVYIFLIVPLYQHVVGSYNVPYLSGFQGNLLYTGPAGALDNQLGSCRSDRDGGAYSGCGAAEAFRAKYAERSHFVDTGNVRHLQERSRFIGERSPDAVYALEQSDMDAMQSEINAITGDDNEAQVTLGMHKENAQPLAATPAAAPTASTFASRHSAEANLSAIGYGFA